MIECWNELLIGSGCSNEEKDAQNEPQIVFTLCMYVLAYPRAIYGEISTGLRLQGTGILLLNEISRDVALSSIADFSFQYLKVEVETLHESPFIHPLAMWRQLRPE